MRRATSHHFDFMSCKRRRKLQFERLLNYLGIRLVVKMMYLLIFSWRRVVRLLSHAELTKIIWTPTEIIDRMRFVFFVFFYLACFLFVTTLRFLNFLCCFNLTVDVIVAKANSWQSQRHRQYTAIAWLQLQLLLLNLLTQTRSNNFVVFKIILFFMT